MRITFTGTFIFFVVVLFGQSSMNVELIYNWNDTTIPSSIIHNNRYNDVWGYATANEEYAIIGSTDGTHIFDVTDQQNIYMADYVAGVVQGDVQVHRDYHEYKGYLYATCDEGASTLQILDLSYLPDSVHKVYDSDAIFPRAHNIFIDTATAKMYVLGGNLQFAVVSLADPENPSLIVHPPNEVLWWNDAIGYVHDAFIRNDTAFLNAEGRGLFVVDFSNTTDPVLLGSLSAYPQSGYNHSGWLNHAGDIYALADENHGKDIKLFDVTDLTDIQLIDTINTEVHPLSIPHNLLFQDQFLHVAYYHDGYYIWDTSDPANATIVGYYDTSTEPHAPNFRGAWGVYPHLPSGIVLVSDMQNGLFVFNVDQAVGIEELDPSANSEFRIWPVPFNNELKIQGLNGQNGKYSVDLIDISGRVIDQHQTFLTPYSIQSIDLGTDLNAGIYLLVIDNGYQRTTHQIVKSK